jgi:hypothetical protein
MHKESTKIAISMSNYSVHAMEAWRGADVSLHSFISSKLDAVVWSASDSGRFTSRERTDGTHSVGRWVGLSACMDVAETDSFGMTCTLSAFKE